MLYQIEFVISISFIFAKLKNLWVENQLINQTEIW